MKNEKKNQKQNWPNDIGEYQVSHANQCTLMLPNGVLLH